MRVIVKKNKGSKVTGLSLFRLSGHNFHPITFYFPRTQGLIVPLLGKWLTLVNKTWSLPFCI